MRLRGTADRVLRRGVCCYAVVVVVLWPEAYYAPTRTRRYRARGRQSHVRGAPAWYCRLRYPLRELRYPLQTNSATYFAHSATPLRADSAIPYAYSATALRAKSGTLLRTLRYLPTRILGSERY
eukprot:1689112-Rhodomonas_salina.1